MSDRKITISTEDRGPSTEPGVEGNERFTVVVEHRLGAGYYLDIQQTYRHGDMTSFIIDGTKRSARVFLMPAPRFNAKALANARASVTDEQIETLRATLVEWLDKAKAARAARAERGAVREAGA